MKSLRKNKAAGSDKIINEQIKYGGNELFKKLQEIFNEILETQQIPPEWKESDIMLIFKSGNRNRIENYRPITLSLVLSKIFAKLIQLRMYPILDSQQPEEQAGFRKKYSTI